MLKDFNFNLSMKVFVWPGHLIVNYVGDDGTRRRHHNRSDKDSKKSHSEGC